MLFGISLIVDSINTEQKAFEALCKTLPKEKANELIKERRKKQEEGMEHFRALEIAEASRARNFWGN